MKTAVLDSRFFIFKQMNKQQILEKLKSVKYPGFNRDIVSFGMVKEISIESKNVELKLKITSQNEEKKLQVIKDVKKLLGKYFSDVKITVANQTLQDNNFPNQTPQNNILSSVKNIIAVASGKGGVGKSTIAANLACSLSKKGAKVGLLDLDIYGPSLPILFDVKEQPEMSKDNKLIPIKKFGMELMSFGFISGNDTPVIWRGPLVARMTEQFFRDVQWGDLDYLLLDLPPGTGDIQLTLTQKLQITGAVIVTTPQDIALADVRKASDMFQKVKAPVIGVIENMSGFIFKGSISPAQAELNINGLNIEPDSSGKFNIKFNIFKSGGGKKESERIGVPLLGQIPFAQEIMEASDSGMPLALQDENNSVSHLYDKLAKQIQTILEKSP
mgnify:CR=1 FL=1|tara:strand:+ start:1865 stop:3022 length:1158 start_codon:yes stop_codon:yes gene_type:complete